jgi:hypothetical protein
MPAIDTRHTERDTLFMLLIAKHTGDIDREISRLRSKMEKEDVRAVTAEFEEWQKASKPNA